MLGFDRAVIIRFPDLLEFCCWVGCFDHCFFILFCVFFNKPSLFSDLIWPCPDSLMFTGSAGLKSLRQYEIVIQILYSDHGLICVKSCPASSHIPTFEAMC